MSIINIQPKINPCNLLCYFPFFFFYYVIIFLKIIHSKMYYFYFETLNILFGTYWVRFQYQILDVI